MCSLSGRNCVFKCKSYKFRVSLSYDTCQISVSLILGNLKINTKNFEYYPNLECKSVVKLFFFFNIEFLISTLRWIWEKEILRMGMISIIVTDPFPECIRESNNLILQNRPYLGYDIYLHSVCSQTKKISGGNFFSHITCDKIFILFTQKRNAFLAL